MVETKARNEMNSEVVQQKAIAGREYCRAVTEWSKKTGGKPWTYALVAHDEVNLNSSFGYLVDSGRTATQMRFDI